MIIEGVNDHLILNLSTLEGFICMTGDSDSNPHGQRTFTFT